MLMLAELSLADQPLSVMRKPYERYSPSGEINTQVIDTGVVIERVADALQRRRPGSARWADGRLRRLVVQPAPRNTEPLLRLNLEAANRDECDDRVVEVLAFITAD